MPEERLTAARGPLETLLEKQGVVILDGGLASELEARGADLRDDLWSARLLRDDPELLQQVHRAYLEAGADCIVTASYQASEAGFRRQGSSAEESAEWLRLSVRLACRARDEFWQSCNNGARHRPLVAASIGPFGAVLADGSEYRGAYGLREEALYRFHVERWKVLAEAGGDLMACETIPDRAEVLALGRLFDETPELSGWVALSCRDPEHLADGTELVEVAAGLDAVPGVVALGVNCVPPAWVPRSLAVLRQTTAKPLVAYPNSGESWNAEQKRWDSTAVERPDLGAEARQWIDAGARLLGGCCRTGPADIASLRRAVIGRRDSAQLSTGAPKSSRR